MALSFDLICLGIFIVSFQELIGFDNGTRLHVEGKIFGKFACQDSVMILQCSSPKTIKIIRARYSRDRKQEHLCRRALEADDAEWCDPVDRTRFVQRKCDDLVVCNITVNNITMGNSCPDVYKYLNVMYTCHTLKATAGAAVMGYKSTMVLTIPPALHSTQTSTNPTEKSSETDVRFQEKTSKEKKDSPREKENPSSADVEFVGYNCGNIHVFSCWGLVLIQLLAVAHVLFEAHAVLL